MNENTQGSPPKPVVSMRALTVIDSLAVGGAEQSLSMMVPHMVARGVDMQVAYLTERRGVAQELVAAGATLHSLDGATGRLAALRNLRRLMRRLQPDVVHTTLFKADVLGRTAAASVRIPLVSSFVTESYGPEHVSNPEYRAWKVRAAQAVDATTARFVTRFHAVSAASADVMADRLMIRRDKIEVISRGRDPRRLGVRSADRRARLRAELGIENDQIMILAAARHYHLKGLDVLVRAFPKVYASFPNARLVIAGRDGPATAELERLIDGGGVRAAVRLIGYRADVPDLMCAADVFALPSRAEGSPGALIEAMALQAPIVATDIPSVRELAGDTPVTANLSAVGSADDMSRALLEMIYDPGMAASMAAAGRKRFLERYTMDAIADATVDLYRRVASAR